MKERMYELIELLNRWDYAYYTLDDPLVSDGEYDARYAELVKLEKETGFTDVSSPTRRVGGEVLPGFAKHEHLAPLYSLDKSQSFGELSDWIGRCERAREAFNAENPQDSLPPLQYVVEYKFDGLTLNLTYDGGALVMAATRGNGVVGEEILPQVETIRSVPLRIPYTGKIEVQGEGLMPLSAFRRYNETAEFPLKNARNAAAGALRNLDTRETARRRLTAFFYSVGYAEEALFQTQEEMLKFLRENRFKVSGMERVVRSYEEIVAIIGEIAEERERLDFLTDGVVIKIDDLKTRAVLGSTAKFPRWAMAYKFEAEETTTILLNVEWNVGRTGKVTPTAVLEPVEIGGATVSRATLNNYDDICRKGVELGGRVLIRRSNEVIPEILGSMEDEELTPQKIEKPRRCPACFSELVQDGVHLFCLNSLSCRPQLIARMTHFASRNAMDIAGLSEKTVAKLMDECNVSTLAGIYDLKREDLLSLEGFKEKRTDNLLTAIENSKRPTLSAFLYAIGVPGVGEKTARELSDAFGTLDRLAVATREELVRIPDIGDVMAEEIFDFFHDEEIRKGLAELLSKGIEIEERRTEKAETFLAGKRIVVTGTIDGYTRSELEERLRSMGAVTSSSVSKNTDFVIAGEKAGSKLDKAVSLGVKVVEGARVEDFLDGKL